MHSKISVIREMQIHDYDRVFRLMTTTSGISVRDADSKDAIEKYLLRNPGLSFIAEVGSELVGCVMSGHDGRRGYLNHLIVDPTYRNQGIGTDLVNRCVRALEFEGILKTHIDVIKTNVLAAAFWERSGWKLRTDIHRYSFIKNGNPNV